MPQHSCCRGKCSSTVGIESYPRASKVRKMKFNMHKPKNSNLAILTWERTRLQRYFITRQTKPLRTFACWAVRPEITPKAPQPRPARHGMCAVTLFMAQPHQPKINCPVFARVHSGFLSLLLLKSQSFSASVSHELRVKTSEAILRIHHVAV